MQRPSATSSQCHPYFIFVAGCWTNSTKRRLHFLPSLPCHHASFSRDGLAIVGAICRPQSIRTAFRLESQHTKFDAGTSRWAASSSRQSPKFQQLSTYFMLPPAIHDTSHAAWAFNICIPSLQDPRLKQLAPISLCTGMPLLVMVAVTPTTPLKL